MFESCILPVRVLEYAIINRSFPGNHSKVSKEWNDSNHSYDSIKNHNSIWEAKNKVIIYHDRWEKDRPAFLEENLLDVIFIEDPPFIIWNEIL